MLLALLVLTAAVSYAAYGFACYHYLQSGRNHGSLTVMNLVVAALAVGALLYAKDSGIVVSDFEGMLCTMSGVLALFSTLQFGLLKYLHVPTRTRNEH